MIGRCFNIFLLLACWALMEYTISGFYTFSPNPYFLSKMLKREGWWFTMFHVFCRLPCLFLLPQSILAFISFVIYGIWPETITVSQRQYSKKIIVRIVTDGQQPDLVRYSLRKNLKVCSNFDNFKFYLITNQLIGLSGDLSKKVTQVLVPESYKSTTGVKFKARNLQYCLDYNIGRQTDNSWTGK